MIIKWLKRITNRNATHVSRDNIIEKSVFDESDAALRIAGLHIFHGHQQIIENGWFRRDDVMQGEDEIGFIQVIANKGKMTISVFAKAEGYCASVRNIAYFSMRRQITTWNSTDTQVMSIPVHCYR